MPGTHRRTTTQRGLGNHHRRQVDRLKSLHVEGTPCWWCNRPMFSRNPELNIDGKTLQGDHSLPRSSGGAIADRLLHATCNAERGDGSRDHLRPALTGQQTTAPDTTDVGHRAMVWP